MSRILNFMNLENRQKELPDVDMIIQKSQLIEEEAVFESHFKKEVGEEVYRFLYKYADIFSPTTFVVSTTTLFNIEYHAKNKSETIINLRRVNDLRYINKFFESVNRKLIDRGIFIGCCETKNMRKQRILRKFPFGMNYLYYTFDFIIKRIFPKFMLTKRMYFILTRGQNRVITRAEVLGRLYSCGFEVVDDQFFPNLYYFVARKVTSPAYDNNPTYGPIVRLSRVGKNGKPIKVLKMRTMHPFSEYLQEYIFYKNNLKEGGKFKNDFRVSTLGKIMRTFWLDELPMLVNLFRGDMKLFGVRPISKHYYNLYTKELQERRIKHKPGLIPPFYVHYPRTLEEIMASEMKYLEEFEKHPFWTDWKYFWKAIFNIIFKKYRSS